MKNTHTIELGEDELNLIKRALDLYSQVGMLQFEYLTDCFSLQKLVWDKDLTEEFRATVKSLKKLFGYDSNSNPGIFNKDFVGDDCRIAANMYQQIRHQQYLNRLKSGEQTKRFNTNAEYPADICQIAGMKEPEFKFI